MTSPQIVRDYLRTKLAELPHEVFVTLLLFVSRTSSSRDLDWEVECDMIVLRSCSGGIARDRRSTPQHSSHRVINKLRGFLRCTFTHRRRKRSTSIRRGPQLFKCECP